MDMRVDQAGHHRSAAGIDDGGVRALDWPVGDLLEAIALDQDIDALAQLAAGGIEEIAAAEQEHGDALQRVAEQFTEPVYLDRDTLQPWRRNPDREDDPMA